MKINNTKDNLLSKKSLRKLYEYNNHEIIYPLDDKKSKLKGYIVIHKLRGEYPSFGATRFLKYKSKKEALKDVLRLANLMSYKSALAGLEYGGAKAVIIEPKGKYSKKDILRAYAKELKKFENKFITGTDVGLSTSDLDILIKKTSNIVGISVNPEEATACGIILSLKESLIYKYNNFTYKNYSYAIQGVGKVGSQLLSMLVKRGVKNIYIADIDKNKLKIIKNKYPFIKIVSPDKIYKQKIDVYCPCALSSALNNKTIDDLKCDIIIGSANNQLEHESIGLKLHKKNILYTPDYIVNSGGLISVVDEFQNNKSSKKRLSKRIEKIASMMKLILEKSKKENKPPYIVAKELGLLIINS